MGRIWGVAVELHYTGEVDPLTGEERVARNGVRIKRDLSDLADRLNEIERWCREKGA